MQKPTRTTKDKTNILLVVSLTVLLISVSIGFDSIDPSERVYYAIHVVSLIFGVFLSVLGFLTYREFKNTRLLMVFGAFVAITVAESTSWLNLVYPLFESTYGLHGYVTHSLILLMLSFFIIGIFRSD